MSAAAAVDVEWRRGEESRAGYCVGSSDEQSEARHAG